MSSLHPGDEGLHYCDHSHRWIAPSEIEQELWEAALATHLEQHRSTMDRPSTTRPQSGCRTRRPVAKPAPAPVAKPAPVPVVAAVPIRRVTPIRRAA